MITIGERLVLVMVLVRTTVVPTGRCRNPQPLKWRPTRCLIARPGCWRQGPHSPAWSSRGKERLPDCRECRIPSRKASKSRTAIRRGIYQLAAPFRVPIRELTETWNSAAKCSVLLRVADAVDTGSECRQRPDGHAQNGTRVTWSHSHHGDDQKIGGKLTPDFAARNASSA